MSFFQLQALEVRNIAVRPGMAVVSLYPKTPPADAESRILIVALTGSFGLAAVQPRELPVDSC